MSTSILRIGVTCAIAAVVLLLVVSVLIDAFNRDADEYVYQQARDAQARSRAQLKAAKVSMLTADKIAKRADEVLAETRAAIAAGAKPVTVTRVVTERVEVPSPCGPDRRLDAQAEWRSVELIDIDANRWLKATLGLDLREFDERANLTWSRHIDMPIDPLKVEMTHSTDDTEGAESPTVLAPRLHRGRGFVCGATGALGVVAWPEVNAGVMVGVGCTWGRGIVR